MVTASPGRDSCNEHQVEVQVNTFASLSSVIELDFFSTANVTYYSLYKNITSSLDDNNVANIEKAELSNNVNATIDQ